MNMKNRTKRKVEHCARRRERDDSERPSKSVESDGPPAAAGSAPKPGECVFLDKDTPEGLFDPLDEEVGRALIISNSGDKMALFFGGDGPKFRHHVLGDDKVAFGRWWPLQSIVSKGLVRMLTFFSGGTPIWRAIGLTEAEDGFIDDYDIMAEGWEKPFASRDSREDHEAEEFECLEPLRTTFVIAITA
jgi:hypothetical protein